MSESLREMIAKIKEQQPKKPNPFKKKVEETEDEAIKEDEEELNESDEEEEEEEQEEETEEEEQKNSKKPKEEVSPEEKVSMEIELLQNNGRFRGELLYQLQKINTALTVIAKVLVDLTDGKKEN